MTNRTKLTYELRGDGIYSVKASGDIEKIAEPIKVTAFGTGSLSRGKEQAYTEIKFRDRTGKWKREIVRSSMLSAQRQEFVSLLADRGYTWPSDSSSKRWIVGVLSAAQPKNDFRVVSVPGWHNGIGRAFVLPDLTYAREKVDRKAFRLESPDTVLLGPFELRGALDAWQNKIAKACRHSSRVRLAVSAVFAAPNLRHLQMDSFGLNFSGETSSGKTLLSRLCASAAGLNASAGPPTWDGSEVSFGQRALGHRDCVTLLDDLSHLGDDSKQVAQITKVFTFRMASNRPKTLSGQYAKANNLVDEDWRVITLSTSEDDFWKRQVRKIRGEEVRMINIRACASEMGDIFDGTKAMAKVGSTSDERRKFVERHEELCYELQGTPFRAYLERRLSDKSAEPTLRIYMEQFVGACPIPGGIRAAGRIRRRFAVIYASAALAIDYGIVPWKKAAALKDIKACFDDAVGQLATPLGADVVVADSKDEELIQQLRERLSKAEFISPSGAAAEQLQSAAGIKRRTKSGKLRYLLKARPKARYADSADASRKARRKGGLLPYQTRNNLGP
jgi:Domain of unknown function (DUF927)